MGLARLPGNLCAFMIAIWIVSLPAYAHTDVTAAQAKDLVDSTDDLVVVDVREPHEYCDARGHIPGALDFPWNSGVLQARYEELPMESPILLVCRSGGRSNAAANFLYSQGFSTVYDMLGGMNAWAWQTLSCKYSGGSGTANDPYQIATAADLIALGETPDDYDKHFKLVADIDLAGTTWSGPVVPEFDGVFDGGGLPIKDLTIVSSDPFPGLFGSLHAGAQVTNLRVVDANITDLERGTAGMLAALNDGIVVDCCASGTIASGHGVGGLVGRNSGSVICCWAAGSVSAIKGVGGLVGRNTGSVDNSYSAADVSGRVSVGGLVGDNESTGAIVNSYSAGLVSDIPPDLDVNPATPQGMGGLVGRNRGQVDNSFWDVMASGLRESDGGSGKTSAEMQTATTFLKAGWDFIDETENGTDDVWKIVEGQTYPLLSWQKYAGGTGEPNDPYLIYTAEHLNALGAEPNDYDKHFTLMADIDLEGYRYDAALIAPDVDPCDLSFNGASFAGAFDGNGHAIFHLTITGESYLGLFGHLEYGAQVKNLGAIDANVTGSTAYTGGLVGFSKGRIAMSYCTGMVSGDRFVGGLAGRNWGRIATSYSAAMVMGKNDVGGLTAGNYGSITNCYNTGAVAGNWNAGGLVGANSGSITASYSTGAVGGEIRSGGLVGYNNWDYGVIASSFWDVGSSGVSASDGGTPLTTAEMQTATTFLNAGWDLVDETANGSDDIWWILEGQDYPRLRWEHGDEPPL